MANSRSVPAFLNKLYSMVGDPSTDNIIRWGDNGESFLVRKQERFRVELLPKFFKHSNLQSFVRQLNMYGFKKVPQLQHGNPRHGEDDDETLEYGNPFFKRDNPQLLCNIERKRGQENNVTTTSTHQPPISDRQVSESKLRRGSLTPSSGSMALTHVPTSLLSELALLRKQQANISHEIKELKDSSQGLWREAMTARERHKRQGETINKILKFLASVFGGNFNPNAGSNSPVNGALSTPTHEETDFNLDTEPQGGMDSPQRRDSSFNTKGGRRVFLIEGRKDSRNSSSTSSNPNVLIETPGSATETPGGQIFPVHDDDDIPVISNANSFPSVSSPSQSYNLSDPNFISQVKSEAPDPLSTSQSTRSNGAVARRFTNLDSTPDLGNHSTSQDGDYVLPQNIFTQPQWDPALFQALYNAFQSDNSSGTLNSQQIFPINSVASPSANDVSMFLSDNPSDYASPPNTSTDQPLTLNPDDILPNVSDPSSTMTLRQNQNSTDGDVVSTNQINRLQDQTGKLESQVDNMQAALDKLVETLPIDWNNAGDNTTGGQNGNGNAFDVGAFLKDLCVTDGGQVENSQDLWGDDLYSTVEGSTELDDELDRLEDNQHWYEDVTPVVGRKRKLSEDSQDISGVPKGKPRLEIVDD